MSEIKELIEMSKAWTWTRSNIDLAAEHSAPKGIVSLLRKAHGFEEAKILKGRVLKSRKTGNSELDRLSNEIMVFVSKEIAQRKWTQTEFALACGVTQSGMSQKFKNLSGWSLKTLCAAAEAFGKRMEIKFVDANEKQGHSK